MRTLYRSDVGTEAGGTIDRSAISGVELYSGAKLTIGTPKRGWDRARARSPSNARHNYPQ